MSAFLKFCVEPMQSFYTVLHAVFKYMLPQRGNARLLSRTDDLGMYAGACFVWFGVFGAESVLLVLLFRWCVGLAAFRIYILSYLLPYYNAYLSIYLSFFRAGPASRESLSMHSAGRMSDRARRQRT